MGFDTYMWFIMVLVLVIGMIDFIALMVRRASVLNRIAPGSSVNNGSSRLAVIESCPVDSKRRLVLVRRDQTEHLLLLTGTGPGVVIERGENEPAGRGRRKKARGKNGDGFAAVLDQEDAAAEDEPVTRLVGIGKSAWR
ncbi:MAG: flagellar biosynthetic protein FliO [Pseudomonadota bacterium]|nr:flagellar biosynthetic protein FliO [Pseudomonadota bacterium]